MTAAEHVALAAEVVADHSPLPERVEGAIDTLAAIIIAMAGKPLSDQADPLERLAKLIRG